MIETAQYMLETEYGKLMLWLAFNLLLMGVDLITGFIQATINKNIISGKMSMGLLKKFALIFVMVSIIPLTILLPDVISVSIVITIYVVETINELISINENLSKMGLDFTGIKYILSFLEAYNKKGEKK